MTSMAVAKFMEEKSGMAIKKIVKLLRPLRTGILINNSTGHKTEIDPRIPEEYSKLITDLSRGY